MDTPADIPSPPLRRRARARIVRGALAATVLCLPAALTATVEEQRARLPPPCFPGLRHYRVAQEAFGSLDGMRVDVAGRNLRLEEQYCPRSYNSYNLDHFSGVIDAARQEFQARNNDGGRDIDEPTVFRRVRCFEPETVPHPVVAPPAFVPPARRSQGCAR